MYYLPTLEELFYKYNIDYKNIKKLAPIKRIKNIKNYIIECDNNDLTKIIVVNNKYYRYSYIEFYDVNELLKLKVNINTWNIYRWGGYKIKEEDVINLIYEKLNK